MKRSAYLLALVTLIVLGWQYPMLDPLKLLVVLFHESSHALATLLTGGSVVELVIVPEQGGHVLSKGGNRFVILSAGYLGSLLWGVAIYLASVKSRYDQVIMIVLGVVVMTVTAVFGRGGFSWGFGLGAGLTMVLVGSRFHRAINDFALRLIGLTNMLYVPLDIYSDILERSHLRSDAYLLAQETFGTTVMWGSLWLLITLGVIAACLRVSLAPGEHPPDRTPR
ncbi:MAG TPA: M50 family metallopeptidase [Methylococcaceae bacterium]|nr:M50 family metallopeptidase [Methylococcaceae bacterium]